MLLFQMNTEYSRVFFVVVLGVPKPPLLRIMILIWHADRLLLLLFGYPISLSFFK